MTLEKEDRENNQIYFIRIGSLRARTDAALLRQIAQ